MQTNPATPLRLAVCECLTALGRTNDTLAALLRGECALRATPVLGREGGDHVPIALLPGRALDEEVIPAWLAPLRAFFDPICGPGWGTPRRPICVTSSNFGVGSLYAYRRTENHAHTPHGSIRGSVAQLRNTCGWSDNIIIFSHACISAHLGLTHAARLLEAGVADEVLVVSYDFLSPFVTGGFHSLKILNANFPAPYMDRATGSIGLGDGAAYAVLTRDTACGDFAIIAQNMHNEMYHFTANQPDGAGFATALAPIARAAAQAGLDRLWFKGHGTGTIEAGRLESNTIASAFPHAPLTGWKGALGHTLGSCGLVELAIAAASMRTGRAPGTIGTATPTFTPAVATAPIDLRATDAVVCASNAFGGAHAALLMRHV